MHLVYPHGDSVACPHAIGVELAKRLRLQHRVLHYDLTHPVRMQPEQGDVLLGFPDSTLWSPFRRSLDDPRWGRKIAMAPFTHGDARYCAYLDRILPKCDAFLAITGQYWFKTTPESSCRHWFPKMVHLDLAIDRANFPALKKRFNAPGKRRFVYIGHSGFYKNVGYLNEIARAMRSNHFGWIGDAKEDFESLCPQGQHDFRSQSAREIVSSYDFLITVGHADPNPTVILEAMAWGLIPVCTRESGYDTERGIINVPLNDVSGAVRILSELQEKSEDDLIAQQEHNWRRLDGHFTWDRFAAVVAATIGSKDKPPVGAQGVADRLRMRAQELRSPYAFWRYHSFRRSLLLKLFAVRKRHSCADPDNCMSARGR